MLLKIISKSDYQTYSIAPDVTGLTTLAERRLKFKTLSQLYQKVSEKFP